jgi:Skp family chaperone for outer membrane proteins
MKSVLNVMTILSFVGICILGYMYFSGHKKSNTDKRIMKIDSNHAAPGAYCAYVNLDTIDANYVLFKKKKAEFEAREKAIEQELEAASKKLEADYLAFQKGIQEGKITDGPEGQAAQKRLQQTQQELEIKKQNLSSKLIKDSDDFNKSISENIKGFLNNYAAEKGYDFVFAYTTNSNILYVNEANDITAEVLEDLNTGKSYGKKAAETK